MHEMALAEGVLGIIEARKRSLGFARVRAVRLEIGMLAGVEVAALQACLDIVFSRSVAYAARIDCEMLPGSGFCFDCGRTVVIGRLDDVCPECAGPHVQATGGMEMRVRNIVVE